MALNKKKHVVFSPLQEKILEKLSARLGLDISNTIRYCVQRIAIEEGIIKDAPYRDKG